MSKITLPLYVVLPRKTKADRKCIINLNNYRNWNFIISNQIKQTYKLLLEDQLSGLKFSPIIDLCYTYYKGSNRSSDKANVLSIQDKFFCDALTFYGCIEDDNDSIVGNITFRDGGVDKENPRVVVEITQRNFE